MRHDNTRLRENAFIGMQAGAADGWAPWCVRTLEKYDAVHYREALAAGLTPTPYETLVGAGNIVMNGGADLMWERLITEAPSTSSTGVVSQAFSSGNMSLQVGNSTATSGTRTHNTLQATTDNRFAAASSVFTHTSGTSTAARTLTVTAAFTSSEANVNWAEWGVRNTISVLTTVGRLLNRKVEDLGTKTSAGVWTLTLNLTLS